MRRTCIVLVLIMFTLPLYSQNKEKDIYRLMEISGSADLGTQVMYAIIEQYKEIIPDVPDEYWNMVLKEFSSDELIQLIVPIYDRYFTHEEIKDIIKFYETPTGKKMVENLPFITQESMNAGQQWGMEIGERIQNELKKDGYFEI